MKMAARGRWPGASASSRVLAAGKALFMDAGYEGVSLEAVATAAGTTRQTVYNLFGSKEGLFNAVVEAHWTSLATDRDAIFSSAQQPASDAEAVLLQFGRTIVRFVEDTDQIAFTRFVIAESRRHPWIAETFYRSGKGPLLRDFVRCLQDLTREKKLECREPLIAAHQFFGLIQEFVIWPRVMSVSVTDDEIPIEKVIAEAVLTFLSRYAIKRVSRTR